MHPSLLIACLFLQLLLEFGIYMMSILFFWEVFQVPRFSRPFWASRLGFLHRLCVGPVPRNFSRSGVCSLVVVSFPRLQPFPSLVSPEVCLGFLCLRPLSSSQFLCLLASFSGSHSCIRHVCIACFMFCRFAIVHILVYCRFVYTLHAFKHIVFACFGILQVLHVLVRYRFCLHIACFQTHRFCMFWYFTGLFTHSMFLGTSFVALHIACLLSDRSHFLLFMLVLHIACLSDRSHLFSFTFPASFSVEHTSLALIHLQFCY